MPDQGVSDQLFHRLRIAEVVEETHDARTIVFNVAPNQREWFSYSPGQFLTLRIPSDRGAVARSYSLSSAPATDDKLRITVKRTHEGYGSNWLCDNARPGGEIDVLAPEGIFTPSSLDEQFLLVAGGSGITPIMSILKSVLAEGEGSVTVVYANRDERSVIMRRELEDLAAAHPSRLVVLHWLESVQGLPSRAALAALFGALRFERVFICGPKPFMTASRQGLTDAGTPKSNLHIERFASLAGDPFSTRSPAPDPDHPEIASPGEDREVVVGHT